MKYLFYTVGSILLFIFGNSIVVAQTIILEENFDAGIPSAFVIYNRDGYTPHSSVAEYTDAWISGQDPSDVSNTVASATSYFDQPGMADRWLVTSPVTLGAFGNILSWTGKSHDASYAESYLVLISTTDTSVESFTDTLKAVVNEDIYWTNHSVNLSEEGYDNQTVHIAFVLRTIDGFKFYLDSLNIVSEDPVGLNKQASFEFRLYPNPTTDKITFESGVPVQQAIVRDINGAVILETEDMEINVRDLSAGIYFLELVHSGGVSSKKFIKR